MTCMASSPGAEDDLFDEFLSKRGHETESERWDQSYSKKQCPDCGGLHEDSATECSVCGWQPTP